MVILRSILWQTLYECLLWLQHTCSRLDIQLPSQFKSIVHDEVYRWISLREIWLCRHNRAQHYSLGCLYHCITRFTAFALEQLRISTLSVWSTL